jgi:hypothetical protein
VAVSEIVICDGSQRRLEAAFGFNVVAYVLHAAAKHAMTPGRAPTMTERSFAMRAR